MSLLGRLGVWTFVDGMPAAEGAAVAKRIEAWGYSALWLPEAVGRDPFVTITRVEIESGLSLSDRLIDNPAESTETGEVVRIAGEEAKFPTLAASEKAEPVTAKSD